MGLNEECPHDDTLEKAIGDDRRGSHATVRRAPFQKWDSTRRRHCDGTTRICKRVCQALRCSTVKSVGNACNTNRLFNRASVTNPRRHTTVNTLGASKNGCSLTHKLHEAQSILSNAEMTLMHRLENFAPLGAPHAQQLSEQTQIIITLTKS